MKRLILSALLFSIALPVIAADIATEWSVCGISVSTVTVTAIPTTPLAGRYKVKIINTDPNFRVYIGSSTAVSVADGFLVDISSRTNTVDLEIPSDRVIYGIGQANPTTGTVNVRVIEYKKGFFQ